MAQERRPFGNRGLTIMALIALVIASTSLAFYLYQPYKPRFASTLYLTPFTHVVAAIGAFMFSRRWLGSQIASFFAALLYAFGPFALALDPLHPAIPSLLAVTPWCFCPAAFWQKWLLSPEKLPRLLRLAITIVLSLLPLVPIALVFRGLPLLRVFPMPVWAGLVPADLITIIGPTHVTGGRFSVGFYHVAIPAIVLGAAIFVRMRRYLPCLVIVATIVLAFLRPVLEVSPAIWLVIATLGLSIIAGVGLEGMTLITASDRKWLFASLAVTAAALIGSLALGLSQAPHDLFSARLFAMALVPPAFITFMAWRNLRIRQLRWLLLAATLGIDIVLSSRQLVDLLF
jgi:hypothetical protein